MKKRVIPKSIERQMQRCRVLGKPQPLPEAKPYDYANMPDDLPSVEHWYNVRERFLFQQENMGANG